MNFQLHLKKVEKEGQTRVKFDLEKLKDPDIAAAFKAMMGENLLPSPSSRTQRRQMQTQ